MTEAVIFDFDGVIADTMPDNYRAWQSAFAPYGVTVPADEYYVLEGMGRQEIALYFLRKHQLDTAKAAEIAASKEQYYKDSHDFRLFPGVTELLSLLQGKGLKLALVTGASRERITATLAPELQAYFSSIVTVDDVQRGKPDPEPYLTAISKLGCDPSRTIVVENAKLGIESAIAAGCTCFALETTLDSRWLGQAARVFPDHAALTLYFKDTLS